MNTIYTLVLVAHVIVGAAIVGLVLLQRGKGAEAGAAFGAGASATVFGSKGSANFLSRSTAVLATLFFGTSLTLAYFGAQRPVAETIIQAPATDAGTGVQAAPGAATAEVPEVPAPGAGEVPAAPAGNAPPPAGP